MHPILITIGGYQLHSFGVLMSLAVAMGSLVVYQRASKLYGERVLDFCFWAVLAGLAGSRLWEVLFTWNDYRANPWTILALWQGGLSIQGGILGGVIAGYFWTRKEKIPFWQFADLVTPAILLGQAIGRVGCFLAGDDYGIPTASFLGVVYAAGSPAYQVYGAQPLVPAELLEGIWDLVIIALILGLERLALKRFTGFNFPVYLGLYSAGRIVLENYRGFSLTIGEWKTAQVAGAAGIILALVIFLLLWRRSKRVLSE
ncbi:MAG TPA: prolipoprotein diacylglyceryl transferase [Desulfobacteria bacterium]|nr:prolipoprotein diacylglyceryl transferase [Desulfobacteria bacterium]